MRKRLIDPFAQTIEPGNFGFDLLEALLQLAARWFLRFRRGYVIGAIAMVLAAIALWAKERQAAAPALRPVPVYFIGVGEKLEDLETFSAREFAQALLA